MQEISKRCHVTGCWRTPAVKSWTEDMVIKDKWTTVVLLVLSCVVFLEIPLLWMLTRTLLPHKCLLKNGDVGRKSHSHAQAGLAKFDPSVATRNAADGLSLTLSQGIMGSLPGDVVPWPWQLLVPSLTSVHQCMRFLLMNQSRLNYRVLKKSFLWY